MKIIAHTESGSKYTIDLRKRTFSVEKSATSGLRTTEGKYLTINEIEVGKPIIMAGDPLNPDAGLRLIQTSPVVRYGLRCS